MEFSNVRVIDVKIAMGAQKIDTDRIGTTIKPLKNYDTKCRTRQEFHPGHQPLILQFFGEIESFNDYIQSKIDDYHEIESIY